MIMECNRVEKVTDPDTKQNLFRFYFVPTGNEKPKKDGDWICLDCSAISAKPNTFVAGQTYDVNISVK